MEKYQFGEGQKDHLKADNIYYKLYHIFFSRGSKPLLHGCGSLSTGAQVPGVRVPDINRSHLTASAHSDYDQYFYFEQFRKIRWQLLKTIPRICIYQSFYPQHCRQWVTLTSRNLCWRQLTVPELLSYLLSIIYYLQTFLNGDVDTVKNKQSSEKEEGTYVLV